MSLHIFIPFYHRLEESKATPTHSAITKPRTLIPVLGTSSPNRKGRRTNSGSMIQYLLWIRE